MDDDSNFPDLFDTLESDGDPTARGIVQCLRMLVEEAATLRMERTLAALQTAMTICADEGETEQSRGLSDHADARAPGMLLH